MPYQFAGLIACWRCCAIQQATSLTKANLPRLSGRENIGTGTRPRVSACRNAAIDENPKAAHSARPPIIGPCLSSKSRSISSARLCAGAAVVICHAQLRLDDVDSRYAIRSAIAEYWVQKPTKNMAIASTELLYIPCEDFLIRRKFREFAS